MLTGKKRMLNAYKGIADDRAPVAPEFWNYYPAKVLGVSMIEFEREIPFWKALKTVFEMYECEGFAAAFPNIWNENLDIKRKIDGYRETTTFNYKGNRFESWKMYDKVEPCWVTRHLSEDIRDFPLVLEMLLDMDNEFDYESLENDYIGAGESFLLELWCGVPFFDFIAENMGFQNAVYYFQDEDEAVLYRYRERYIEYQKRMVRKMVQHTSFESFMIGCSYSCNSLIGTTMWRKWDKPYLKEICEEVHKYGKLLHVHFHGKSLNTVSDFAELKLDCVCPFEKPPGGDIQGMEGLRRVRNLLNDQVTMNGNVHTVETLIRGTTEDVRKEVRMIKKAFEGSSRYIIGTGDQVGRETPKENIIAMIDEAKILS